MELRIKGYERYTIDHLGAVRDLREKLRVQPEYSVNGYPKVFLYDIENKGKWFYIKDLMAQAFVPNPLRLDKVRMKNDDPNDLRANNLEWYSDLSEFSYSRLQEYLADVKKPPELYVSEHKNWKNHKSPILQKDLEGRIIAEYPTIKDAAKATGLSKDNICHVVNGDRLTAGGFRWERVMPDGSEKTYKIIHPSRIPIKQYTLDNELVAEFKSINEASRTTGIPAYIIRDISLLYPHIAKGYKWIRGYYDSAKQGRGKIQQLQGELQE